MNRLVIIGNGFDLAHDLETSYKDFIDWYWEQRVSELKLLETTISEDILCRFELVQGYRMWFIYAQNHRFFRDDSFHDLDANAVLSMLDNDDSCIVERSLLLDRITQNIENKGWTDIESDYYELLKANADNIEICTSLNSQMDFLKVKLAEYLSTQKTTTLMQGLLVPEDNTIDLEDVAQSSRNIISDYKQSRPSPEERLDIGRGLYKVEKTMLLNFNYTATAEMYQGQTVKVNYIHGSLDKPKEMIFGYGDEMDKDFQALIDRNENALLENSKSIKYLETSHYRDLLSFIEGGPFQVYIMGHSCGNSDRTLLNTIFEHQNCISIKPFCYFNEKGEDNYSELTRNIYRNFTDKKLFRDRVVNKERCTTLDGIPLINRGTLSES